MNGKTSIDTTDFGKTPQAGQAKLFTLKREGLVVKITNFGGIVTELHVPDAEGNYQDVVLGFKDVNTYIDENIYAGAIVGRIAGRLTKNDLTIDGETYHLTKNYENGHLHGGKIGFDKCLWEADIIKMGANEALRLRYVSPDGEEGYPGNLEIAVIYSLTDEGGLHINFEATTDKATPLCPTNHSYFNLSGEKDIANHILQIDADRIIEVDNTLFPTGKTKEVEEGINDFRSPAQLSDRLPRLFLNHGDNYLVNNDTKNFRKVAEVSLSNDKRCMEVFTDAPMLQFYTGKGLATKKEGKEGIPYQTFSGLCLECQGFSDAMNQTGFQSILLEPEEVFRQRTEYRFKTG